MLTSICIGQISAKISEYHLKYQHIFSQISFIGQISAKSEISVSEYITKNVAVPFLFIVLYICNEAGQQYPGDIYLRANLQILDRQREKYPSKPELNGLKMSMYEFYLRQILITCQIKF
jgi:hypothetical protein